MTESEQIRYQNAMPMLVKPMYNIVLDKDRHTTQNDRFELGLMSSFF